MQSEKKMKQVEVDSDTYDVDTMICKKREHN